MQFRGWYVVQLSFLNHLTRRIPMLVSRGNFDRTLACLDTVLLRHLMVEAFLCKTSGSLEGAGRVRLDRICWLYLTDCAWRKFILFWNDSSSSRSRCGHCQEWSQLERRSSVGRVVVIDALCSLWIHFVLIYLRKVRNCCTSVDKVDLFLEDFRLRAICSSGVEVGRVEIIHDEMIEWIQWRSVCDEFN